MISHRRSKFQKTLGTNLSGRRTTMGRNSGERVINTTKGEDFIDHEVKLSGKRTEKGCLSYLSLSFLCSEIGSWL